MKKKFLGIICLLYSIIIFYVWISGTLKNFLAPQMQIYLKVSAFPLLIMGLVIFFSKKFSHQLEISDFMLFLPLILLILAGDGRLTSSFAANRATTFNNDVKIEETTKDNQEEIKDTNDKKEEETETTNKEEYDFNNPDFDVIDESYDELASYMSFVPFSSKYHGKTIKVRGFVLKKDTYIPEGYFSLGKYTISCCAADATFLGFIVKEGDFTVENDKWYEIEGVLEDNPDKSNGIMTAIRVINIKPIDGKKEEQYVYPCYAYDDGSCKEISKYDLQYE